MDPSKKRLIPGRHKSLLINTGVHRVDAAVAYQIGLVALAHAAGTKHMHVVSLLLVLVSLYLALRLVLHLDLGGLAHLSAYVERVDAGLQLRVELHL